MDHFSYANNGDDSRHAYILHVVEGADDVTYCERNWLQYKGKKPFPALPVKSASGGGGFFKRLLGYFSKPKKQSSSAKASS